LICLLLVFAPYVTAFLAFPPLRFFLPLTNWTLMVTTASLIASYKAAADSHTFGPKAFNVSSKDRIQVARSQALHHLLYSMSITMNFVVVTVYWTVLHRAALAKHRDVPDVGHIRVIHLYIVHTFPGFACLINTFCTKAVLRWEWRAVATIGCIYTLV